MDRYGMRSVAFVIFVSFSVFYLLHSGGHLDSSTTASSSSGVRSSSQRDSSSVVEDFGMSTVSGEEMPRRRLLQSSGYIGYGALSGDNVPCPPQSGRSYYTPNCQSATGPVNPYNRGCSTITRCARS